MGPGSFPGASGNLLGIELLGDGPDAQAVGGKLSKDFPYYLGLAFHYLIISLRRLGFLNISITVRSG